MEPRPGKSQRPPKPEAKQGVGSDLAAGLILLSQFGLSVAGSMVITLWGAAWLRNRFDWPQWIFLPALALGVFLSISSFRTVSSFLRNRDAYVEKQKKLAEQAAARRRGGKL